MKHILSTVLFILCASLVYSQEHDTLGVFEADSTWSKEIIKFPIGFAPSINYEGYEDVRFSPGWSDVNSQGFWSYMFAWHIKGNQAQTINSLEAHLKVYFDGLMNAVNKDKDLDVPKTTAVFTKAEVNSNANFMGKVEMYDAFHTKAKMTLNVSVKNNYCKEKDISIIVFKLSPKPFEDALWKTFDSAKIKKGICK